MKYFFLVLFLFTKPAWAENSQAEAFFTNSSTSDEIDLSVLNLSYRSNRRNLLWPYKDTAPRALDYGINISYLKGKSSSYQLEGLKLTTLLAYKFSSHFMLQINPGIHHLSKRTTIFTNEIESTIKFGSYFAVFKFSNDLSYKNLTLPSGYTEKLKENKLTAKLVLTPIDFIRVPLSSKLTHYSDGNAKNETSADILFGKSYPLWLWLGFGFYHLKNEQANPNYWTPKKFIAYGPRIDFSYELHSKITFGWSLNLNRSQEENNPWGYSYYNAFTLKYGNRNSSQAGISFIQMQSNHDGSKWKQNDVMLFASFSF